MVAVVLPSLKFAPPARATVTALAWAHAGSAAPAARSGALATLAAMTGSAADASNKKPDMATMAMGSRYTCSPLLDRSAHSVMDRAGNGRGDSLRAFEIDQKNDS